MYRLLLGQTVGNRYEVLSLLGRGGMGAVYLAMDTTLERHVALKAVTLDERAGGTDSVRARFRREARLAARIHHPNVVTVHDFFSDERLDLEFLVMEHLEGEDLGQRVQRTGPLAPGEVLDLLAQAADGVAAGHRAGLVHRDIKPGNLFLTRRGNGRVHVHVLDFGIAKAISRPETATHLTMFGHQPLSPGYASPEQWRGSQDVTPASDVFSLGMSAYYALTGRAAFSQEELALLAAGTPVPPPVLPVGCPPTLSTVLLRALHPDPGARYTDADAPLEALSSPSASGAAAYPVKQTSLDQPTPRKAVAGQPPRPPVREVARTSSVGLIIGASTTVVLGLLLLQKTQPIESASFNAASTNHADGAEWDASTSDTVLAPSRGQADERSSSRPANPAVASIRLDRAPRVASTRELDAALLRHFPSSERGNEPGSARVSYIVLPDGSVQPGSVEVLSATSPRHATAAAAVLNEIRFTPGRSDGQAVRAIGTSTFNWRRNDGDTGAPPKWIPAVDPGLVKRFEPASEGVYDISSVEVTPRLYNESEVSRALERNYPPLLRDAGVGGTVSLRFRVDEDGRVHPATVEAVDSDNDQFSDAAKKVVERMRFSPAMVKDHPVKVLVELPITFQPRY